MARQPKSLFAQMRDEDAAQLQQESSLWNAPLVRWIIIAVGVLLLTFFFPRTGVDTMSGGYDRSLLGTIWTQETLYADHAYPVERDPDVVAQERAAASHSAPPVFKELAGPQQPIAERLSAATSALSEESRKWIRTSWSRIVETLSMYHEIDIDRDSIHSSAVIIRKGDGSEEIRDAASLTDTTLLRMEIEKLTSGAPAQNRSEIRRALLSVQRVALTFDPIATRQSREAAAQSIPTTGEIVRKGDMIVKTGQRLNEQALLRLAGYRHAQMLRSESPFSIFILLGSFGHAVLIIGFIVLYVHQLRRPSFERNGQLGSLIGMTVFTGFLGWLTLRIEPIVPYEFLVLVPAFSIIITIMYEARTAIIMTIAMSIAVGAARGDDFGIMFVLLFGGLLGVYSSRNVQSRTQMFTSIIGVFIGIIIATLSLELARSTPIELLWPKLLMGTVNAVVSPLVAFAAVMAFERIFNVATDLRLDEFDKLNHELLKKLNDQAPGTYQHTLAVARLSEAAAIAIGANATLTRVGAYFHDIGKMAKSEYFVENQMGIANKHDLLTPKKSAAIIRQHVQDGLELAREYGIPERIANFIPMHHGTILIGHFYAKAIEQAESSDTAILESDFRYPGPKPDSKEAGIVMLADAVEALSRLNDGDKASIEKSIETIIIDRVMDGQLSDTPLTLRDLERIKESMAKSLVGMSHKRIRYSKVNPEQGAA